MNQQFIGNNYCYVVDIQSIKQIQTHKQVSMYMRYSLSVFFVYEKFNAQAETFIAHPRDFSMKLVTPIGRFFEQTGKREKLNGFVLVNFC
ncbi:hypothetical protein [Paenisporosarcina indica]|uniref:hypothetical protein n=1 Tax=Paenisporosarcina indica TaxID=650093 RepID=UPI00094FBACB|nr:hypothetical protein [Paenisporosarcina indica]